MTVGDALLSKFKGLSIWTRGPERAPHKPLLILVALARIQAGYPRMTPFIELEQPLRDLLRDFGPPRVAHHPEYPFWRLQRDQLWVVEGPSELKRRQSNTDPLLTELRKDGVVGGFPEKIHQCLSDRPELLREIAYCLLESHFPNSMHEAIANSAGLNLDSRIRSVNRDRRFRLEVISAWQHRGGFCGYNVKLDHTDLGLEAAHIMWVQAGGAEVLDNGIVAALHTIRRLIEVPSALTMN